MTDVPLFCQGPLCAASEGVEMDNVVYPSPDLSVSSTAQQNLSVKKPAHRPPCIFYENSLTFQDFRVIKASPNSVQQLGIHNLLYLATAPEGNPPLPDNDSLHSRPPSTSTLS
jgi:hypothetical protein